MKVMKPLNIGFPHNALAFFVGCWRLWPMVTVQFNDRGEPLESFAEVFLVCCPRCGNCASVLAADDPEHRLLFRSRRLTCTHCGLTRQWASQRVNIDGRPTDWYFHLPLWLQAACLGEILWAFNAAHLSFLDSYVRATNRRRLPNVNRSAASRLPRWIKSGKNREPVLHAIAILHERLRQC
jgi:hypothetical protein